MSGSRWVISALILATVAAAALLLLPFSSDEGRCGSAAFPRYDRESLQDNERWCGDETYDGRWRSGGLLLGGAAAVAVAAVARRSSRPVR